MISSTPFYQQIAPRIFAWKTGISRAIFLKLTQMLYVVYVSQLEYDVWMDV